MVKNLGSSCQTPPTMHLDAGDTSSGYLFHGDMIMEPASWMWTFDF